MTVYQFRAAPLPVRFWSKVDTSAGLFECWPWLGERNRQGYGRFSIADRAHTASRVAWELTNGPIPPELFALHDCDNPPCVNPAHLHLGTRLDNNREMAERGRARNPESYRTHCKRGHTLSGENLWVRSRRGKPHVERLCRACNAINCRERRTAKKAA